MILKFRYKDESGAHYVTSPKYQGQFVMVDSKGKKYFVDEDELDILVGYDSDGKEIYEGDALIDKGGHKWQAVILPQAEMLIGGVYEYLNSKQCEFKLKE